MITDRYQNQIRHAIENGEFLYTLEHVPEVLGKPDCKALDSLAWQAELVGRDPRIRGVNIGDRVKSMDSYSTVECGRVAAEASGKMPLLHLAGKDRDPDEAWAVFQQAFELGLNTFLLVTGDKVPAPTRPGRTRYFDSVNAIVGARRMAPGSFLAGGVSPFKYREEELLNQYLKMAKKIRAGADYLITNVGWDMKKFQELIWYRNARGFRVPIVANLLVPALRWSRNINAKRLAGIHMSDDLLAKIEEEHKDRATEKQKCYRRLALQVVGVKHMGYAGVHLSGIETYEHLCRIMELAEQQEKELPTLRIWQEAWTDAHTFPEGRLVDFSAPGGFYLFDDNPPEEALAGPPVVDGVTASPKELRKYKALDWVDRAVFHDRSVGAAVLGPLFQAVDSTEIGSRALLKLEHAVKEPILGCETCGFCRIPYLFYICPETCPKGLANGPCGGTDGNLCEFKDRECIHSRKYRIAKALGRLPELEETLVPAVEGTRGTSSWVNEYRHTIPIVAKLPLHPLAAAKARSGPIIGHNQSRNTSTDEEKRQCTEPST